MNTTIKFNAQSDAACAGIALTELTLVLPVAFILVTGIVQLGKNSKIGIERLSSTLSEPLSVEQIPKETRRKSGWPSVLQSSSQDIPPLPAPAGIMAGRLPKPSRMPLAATLPIPHLQRKPALLERWNDLRLRELSLLRAGCIGETTSKLGPQSAAMLLVGLKSLPTEGARRDLALTACPLASAVSQTRRFKAVAQSAFAALKPVNGTVNQPNH